MEAGEFHKLAEHLVCRRGPADCRSAVSRAYYAALLYCRDELGKAGVPDIYENSDTHNRVATALLISGNSKYKEVGALLSDLHGQRIRADYHLDKKETEGYETARSLVEDAGEILSEMKSFSSDPERNTIVSEIIRVTAKTKRKRPTRPK
jgi:hypothetical protein